MSTRANVTRKTNILHLHKVYKGTHAHTQNNTRDADEQLCERKVLEITFRCPYKLKKKK